MSCAGGGSVTAWRPPASEEGKESRSSWRPSDLSQQELRKLILAKRRALDAGTNARLSARVVERFFELWPDPEKTIHGLKAGLYQALPDELGLLELEQRLLHLRARLFFPRVLNRQARELEFVEISRDQMRQAQILRAEKAHRAWVVGPYGIQEPHPRLPATPARELDFVVVPGLAFGLSGERIGMGAGFYDRFLARVPDLLRIVLAFDFQLLSHLEQNPWDQPMDWIITEAREFRGPKVVRWLQEWVKGKQLDQENP